MVPIPAHGEGSETDQLLAHFGTNIRNILHETDYKMNFPSNPIEIESLFNGNISRYEK